MQTNHTIYNKDARDLSAIEDNSVELVITSPPYPMIEQWDDLFITLDGRIEQRLDDGDRDTAWDLMHSSLEPVWHQLQRVVTDGGIVCINIGDATRTIDGDFQRYPNHGRITKTMRNLGFQPLPTILWRKPTNKATKFMGSGMRPPNAYTTLEHEHILVFRNGSLREDFPKNARDESAYFREERNKWFSDLWTGIVGERQEIATGTDDGELRQRTGAYPFEIPYRLINMFSVYGDTVLDPFWGTGTTTTAAMLTGRNSIGYELEDTLIKDFQNRLDDIENESETLLGNRISRHREHAQTEQENGTDYTYRAEKYGFPVRTGQEQGITFYEISDLADLDTDPTSVDVSYSEFTMEDIEKIGSEQVELENYN